MAIGLSSAPGLSCFFGSLLQAANRSKIREKVSIRIVGIILGCVLLTKIEATHEVQCFFSGNSFDRSGVPGAKTPRDNPSGRRTHPRERLPHGSGNWEGRG